MATTIEQHDHVRGRNRRGGQRERSVGIFTHPVVLAAAGVVAVGVIAKRGELVRGGARLLAVQLAAAAIGGVVRRSADRSTAGAAAPPPIAIDAIAGWLAETVVGLAFERIEPAVERPPTRPTAG